MEDSRQNGGSNTGSGLSDAEGFLKGVRVLEVANELGEYCGKVLAGLGADVIKVEPPQGEETRGYGPFREDSGNPEESLYFWHYNFGKRGFVCDLDDPAGQTDFRHLASSADVVIDTRPRGYMDKRGVGYEALNEADESLIYVRISPFGDDGPWRDYKASDLVHLALGGMIMNCGYDPDPEGRYDTPPVAPQIWHAYHIAGELAAIGALGALNHRLESGLGQKLSIAVHQAVSSNREADVPNWIFQRLTHYRQTCRHSQPALTPPAIAMTKDGRWILPYRTYLPPAFGDPVESTVALLERHGMEMDLRSPEYADPKGRQGNKVMQHHIGSITDLLISRFLYDRDLWREAQEMGLAWAPCRRPEENISDEHWRKRETFLECDDPDRDGTEVHIGGKWFAPEVPWRSGPRAPRLGEHTDEVLAELREDAAGSTKIVFERSVDAEREAATHSPHGAPFALSGVRVVDLSWLLASAGAGRFLTALGAEVIKVEHASRVDGMRYSRGFAPPGGRAEREAATGPLPDPEKKDLDGCGMFMEINSGKLGISLDLKSDRGKEVIAKLIADADMIVEGFSPGTMDRLGLGYERLKEINPAIIYVQQSGMGQTGTYGRLRSYGPTAQALSGLSEMSGLPEPFPPAGIGYSYLDWFGAYNMALAMLAALHRKRVTGKGCWIDSSQVEAGIYLTGPAILDHSVNSRRWKRRGNRSPDKLAAPHGVYPARGQDRWIAISCFTEAEWLATVSVLGLEELASDPRFSSLAARVEQQDALDAVLTEATRQRAAEDLMSELQKAGVAAGVCQTAEDLCDHDPQLDHLGWMVELPQASIGTWPVREFPVAFSRTPAYAGGRYGRSGPSYGQDTDFVLGSLLNLEHELAELRTAGVT